MKRNRSMLGDMRWSVKRVFELGELATDGRQRNPQRARSADEAALVDHRDEYGDRVRVEPGSHDSMIVPQAG